VFILNNLIYNPPGYRSQASLGFALARVWYKGKVEALLLEEAGLQPEALQGLWACRVVLTRKASCPHFCSSSAVAICCLACAYSGTLPGRHVTPAFPAAALQWTHLSIEDARPSGLPSRLGAQSRTDNNLIIR